MSYFIKPMRLLLLLPLLVAGSTLFGQELTIKSTLDGFYLKELYKSPYINEEGKFVVERQPDKGLKRQVEIYSEDFSTKTRTVYYVDSEQYGKSRFFALGEIYVLNGDSIIFAHDYDKNGFFSKIGYFKIEGRRKLEDFQVLLEKKAIMNKESLFGDNPAEDSYKVMRSPNGDYFLILQYFKEQLGPNGYPVTVWGTLFNTNFEKLFSKSLYTYETKKSNIVHFNLSDSAIVVTDFEDGKGKNSSVKRLEFNLKGEEVNREEKELFGNLKNYGTFRKNGRTIYYGKLNKKASISIEDPNFIVRTDNGKIETHEWFSENKNGLTNKYRISLADFTYTSKGNLVVLMESIMYREGSGPMMMGSNGTMMTTGGGGQATVSNGDLYVLSFGKEGLNSLGGMSKIRKDQRLTWSRHTFFHSGRIHTMGDSVYVLYVDTHKNLTRSEDDQKQIKPGNANILRAKIFNEQASLLDDRKVLDLESDKLPYFNSWPVGNRSENEGFYFYMGTTSVGGFCMPAILK